LGFEKNSSMVPELVAGGLGGLAGTYLGVKYVAPALIKSLKRMKNDKKPSKGSGD